MLYLIYSNKVVKIMCTSKEALISQGSSAVWS